MKRIKILIFSIIVAGSVFFSGCSNSGSNQNGIGTATDSISKEQVQTEVKDVIYPLPSPFVLVNQLNELGATFMSDKLNKVENIDKYISEKDKAINLGVYGADLSYATVYEKTQETNFLAKAVKSLLDDLGVNVDYSKLLSQETKQQIADKDSLISIITNTFYNTYEYLNTNSNPSYSVLMATGLWVESMYHAVNLNTATFNASQLLPIISSQRTSLNKLLELASKFPEDQNISGIVVELNKVKAVYESGQADSFTEQQLKDVTATINSLRKTLVL